jgi:hypothetical protein
MAPAGTPAAVIAKIALYGKIIRDKGLRAE